MLTPKPTEPVVLYSSLTRIVAIQCAIKHIDKTVTIRAPFGPAFCHNHRDHPDNIHRCGWGYITREEAELLTLLRQTPLITDLVNDLRVDVMNNRFDSIHLINNEEEKEDVDG